MLPPDATAPKVEDRDAVVGLPAEGERGVIHQHRARQVPPQPRQVLDAWVPAPKSPVTGGAPHTTSGGQSPHNQRHTCGAPAAGKCRMTHTSGSRDSIGVAANSQGAGDGGGPVQPAGEAAVLLLQPVGDRRRVVLHARREQDDLCKYSGAMTRLQREVPLCRLGAGSAADDSPAQSLVRCHAPIGTLHSCRRCCCCAPSSSSEDPPANSVSLAKKSRRPGRSTTKTPLGLMRAPRPTM